MSLPKGFTFSQSSLQDFVECRRRFELRYLINLAWPAVETEPVLEAERTQQRGAHFHRLVQQHLSGVPVELLDSAVQDEELGHWWANYLEFHKVNLASMENPAGTLHPEISLSAGLGDTRLVAKYDLVAVLPKGRAVIYDWKTNRQRPKRAWMAQRLQTRLYLYLLARAGAELNAGQALQPEALEMVYWFAGFPNQPERFAYNQQAFREDETNLSDLIETIQRLLPGEFSLTNDLRKCAYCNYRSLCERGIRAGEMADAGADLDQESDLEVDFEQIGEIEF
jgi:CRISPR/Cas system-associated exonuclease Cas4 (RecB family)